MKQAPSSQRDGNFSMVGLDLLLYNHAQFKSRRLKFKCRQCHTLLCDLGQAIYPLCAWSPIDGVEKYY